jgi:hypothetical protein
LAGDWQLIITNDFTSLTYPAFTSFDLDKILQKLSPRQQKHNRKSPLSAQTEPTRRKANSNWSDTLLRIIF